MQLAERVAGDASQPEEEGDLRPAQIRSQVPPGLEVRVLEHIRGVDAAAEPLVEPEGDHPPQPLATALDQGFPGRRITQRGRSATAHRSRPYFRASRGLWSFLSSRRVNGPYLTGTTPTSSAMRVLSLSPPCPHPKLLRLVLDP